MSGIDLLTTALYGPQHADSIRQDLIDLYAEVYAQEAATDAFFSIPRFTQRLEAHTSNLGWACVTGEVQGELVGYAYGRPDSAEEWHGLDTVTAPDVRTFGEGGRTFGLCEIMVREPWRGTGIAQTLHDELMASRTEARASLLVDDDHPRVRALYERWGYRVVGTSRPDRDAPLYLSMVRDLG